MITSLLLLQVQANAPLTRQPVAIDVVGYQAVQKALPNGAPDLSARDNYFVKVESHFVLVLDSDRFPVEKDGKRHVHQGAFATFDREWYEENRPATGLLVNQFREVFPRANARLNIDYAGKMVSGPTDNVVSKGNRLRSFNVYTTVTKVEIHSDKRGQVIRRSSSKSTSVMTQGGYESTIFDPSKERVYWCESKPEVRVDAPKYVFEGE